jgi:HEAT repeat protein
MKERQKKRKPRSVWAIEAVNVKFVPQFESGYQPDERNTMIDESIVSKFQCLDYQEKVAILERYRDDSRWVSLVQIGLTDSDEFVVIAALEAVENANLKGLFGMVIPLLFDHQDPLVRAVAADTLLSISEYEHIPIFCLAYQKEADSEVLVRIVNALWGLGVDSAFEKMLTFLFDSNYHTRIVAVRYLGYYTSRTERKHFKEKLKVLQCKEKSEAVLDTIDQTLQYMSEN